MLLKKAKITAVALLLTMSLSACAKEETETTAAKENKVITETISQESEPESAPPADTDSQKEEPPSAAADVRPEGSAVTELNGVIEKLSGNTIVIREKEVSQMGDDVILVGSSVDSPLTTVTFGDATTFIIRNVVNGGINASDISDTAGSSNDLSIDTDVIVSGISTADGINAEKIIIYNFK